MIRTLVKCITIIFLVFVILTVSSHFVRVIIYKNKPDPMQQAVTQALGNKNLVLGSNLQAWIENLGEPDIIVISGSVVKRTEFYWLDRGIGVTIEDEINGDLESAYHKRVVSIILPIQKKASYPFMEYRKIAAPNEKYDSTIEFGKLLDFKLDDLRARNIRESEINKYYENYDASDDVYYHMPFPFSKVYVKVWRNNGKCGGPMCKDDINVIEVGDANMFSISYVLTVLKRFILIPINTAKLILEGNIK